MDFRNARCEVVLRNITTSTDLAKGQRAEITELGTDGFSLLLPANACSKGHLCLVRFFDEEAYRKVRSSPRSVQDKAQRLAVTAKVVSVVASTDQRAVVALELQQFVEKEWLGFTRSFAAIQGA